MTDKGYEILLNTLTPSATRDDATLPDLDRKPDPWESRMQATAECLSWRGGGGGRGGGGKKREKKRGKVGKGVVS
jgi:hypothetical protein